MHATSGNLGQSDLKFLGCRLDSKENPNSKIACLKVSAGLGAKWKESMGIREKGPKDPGSRYSFREECWRRPFAFIRQEKYKKKSGNCWETNYTGKWKTRDLFLKSRSQFSFLKREKKEEMHFVQNIRINYILKCLNHAGIKG